jgi:hypothetical protein
MFEIIVITFQEEFEDTKEAIRISKSKDKQHNGQKKRDKRTNNDLQNIYIKLKIEEHEPQVFYVYLILQQVFGLFRQGHLGIQ